jgi:septum formation inhibitor MinC
MIVKQKNVRVFEITTDNYERFVKFIDSKFLLLKRYLLLIKTNNPKIKEYPKLGELEVRFVKLDFDGSSEKLELEEEKENIKTVVKIEKIVEKEIVSEKTEIYDRIIRGGEEIKTDKRIIFLKRINGGAEIYSSNSIEVYGEIEGKVESDGEFMIIKKIGKGLVIFNGTEIKNIDKLSFIDKNGIRELG